MALPAEVLTNVAAFLGDEVAATAAARYMRGAAQTFVWTHALRRLWRTRGRYDTAQEAVRLQVWVECRNPRNLLQSEPRRLPAVRMSRTLAWYHFAFLEGRALAIAFHRRMRAKFYHEGHPILGVRGVAAEMRTPTGREVVLVAWTMLF